MRPGVLFSVRTKTGRKRKGVSAARASFFLLAVLFWGMNTMAQTLTIVNNSKAKVFYQVVGSDKNTCNNKFSSLATSVEPSAKVVFQSLAEINWSGEKPGLAFEFSNMSVMYVDPSGECTANASGKIGDTACMFAKQATLSTTECGGKAGSLSLAWTSNNGNVLVTIK